LTVNPTTDPTVEITGQPVSRTQASDASGWLPRYEAKCVQLIALQLHCWQFLYNETLQQTSRPLLSKLVWKTTNLGMWSPFWGS